MLVISELPTKTMSFFQLPPVESTEWKSPLARLFGFLFLAAGLLMLLRTPYLFYQKSRLDGGLELPAKILRIESVRSGGGRSGATSSVVVEYQFTMSDRVFKGNRASIFSDSNELYFRLREAYETGREVACFVDPDDPEFNALDKNVRVLDLMGSIILGIPFTVIGLLYVTRCLGIPRRQNPLNRAESRRRRREGLRSPRNSDHA